MVRALQTTLLVLGCLLAAALLAFLFWLGSIIAAAATQAHSFYPYECCHDRDCWPTGRDADAREPDPIETRAGWRLADGTIIPFAETRPSPDGRFHVCRERGQLQGQVIAPAGRRPCLWTPSPGS